jgi:hypothetical protein
MACPQLAKADVPAASHGADAARLYGLDTQHDPWRASGLAWRTGATRPGLELKEGDCGLGFSDAVAATNELNAQDFAA